MKILPLLLEVAAQVKGSLAFRRNISLCKFPEKNQKKFLLQILDRNKNTDFGQKFGFSKIKSIEDFRMRLPVFEYEDLRPYIEKQELTKQPVLNSENPVLYAITSGTTGKPKFIPVLRSTIENFKKIQGLFTAGILHEHPEALKGRVAVIVSPAVEGVYPGSSTPFGSTSGRIYKDMPKMITSKYVFPIEVFEIADYELKYKTILRILLSGSDVTYLATANPSTLVKLVSVLNGSPGTFLKDLREGSFSEIKSLPYHLQPLVRKAITQNLDQDFKMANRLESLLKVHGRLKIQDFLPSLKVVTTWTGGSCRIFVKQLKSQFAETTSFRELGYLASEFRGCIPLSKDSSAGVPLLEFYFYEFAEEKAWEAGKPHFLGLHEIKNKQRYYVFVTTDSGLYRYNMNDIIEVDGFFEKTPLIRFVQKGKGVTNITGEKLYESQLIEAVHEVEGSTNLMSSFFLGVADEDSGRYILYYQPTPEFKLMAHLKLRALESLLDKALGRMNVEYQSKRLSGRLKPPLIVIVQGGAFEAFKAAAVLRGQREGQYKIVALVYKKDLKFDFSRYIDVTHIKTYRPGSADPNPFLGGVYPTADSHPAMNL